MRNVFRAGTAGGAAASAAILPFATRAGPSSANCLTASDRSALIALGYAMAGWIIAFEQDGQGMQWAALCPPGGANLAARYIVGREEHALILLSAGGQKLGQYEASDALIAEVRRREQGTGDRGENARCGSLSAAGSSKAEQGLKHERRRATSLRIVWSRDCPP
jgi:hypothetical protein